MPFLGRTSFGGPFDGYYTALSNLGAAYVRFAPWVRYFTSLALFRAHCLACAARGHLFCVSCVWLMVCLLAVPKPAGSCH
jgi:hypothetical protein